MPQISVIIPVYKTEQTLSRCVDSVLCQTLGDVEIILVDDGSPDGCGAMCDAYSRQHANIRVIHKENAGLSFARNSGLAIAAGDYVMFLDSDDYLEKNCLEALRQQDADLAVGSLTHIYPTFRKRQPEVADELILPARYGEEIPVLLDSERFTFVHAKLYRRRILTEHHLVFQNDRLTGAEDVIFNFSFLAYCESIYVTNQPLHCYVRNAEGLCKRFYPDRFAMFNRLMAFYQSTCRALGLDNDAMRRVLDRIKAVNANETVMIIAGSDYREKARLLDEICADEPLKAFIGRVADRYDEAFTRDIRLLYRLGSRRYLRAKRQHAVIQAAQKPVRTVKMYAKEALRRLHILRKPEDSR